MSCSVPEGASASTTSVDETEDAEAGLLSAALAVLLLISPFFFWGTSMVAMKVCHPSLTVADPRHASAGATLRVYSGLLRTALALELWHGAFSEVALTA